MANNLKIKGNYLIITDDVSNEVYIREIRGELKFTKNDSDEFQFEFVIAKIEQQQNSSFIVGEVLNLFPFADFIDDRTSLPFVSVDELEDFLYENTGFISVDLTGSGGYLTYVATDATLSGDGTALYPLSVVPEVDKYQERFDSLSSLVGGAWHTIPTSAPANSLITIVIDSNINNNSCGVRAVGSGLNRRVTIDRDSTSYWIVKTNIDSDIEIYTTSTDSQIFVESYLK